MNENETSILLVEDDPITLQLHKRLLSAYGKVYSAKSFDAGKKLMSEKDFDLGFFDLNLDGELKGIELLALAQNHKVYPVVVSGESQDEVLEKAFLEGAKDYLLKPFNKEKLNHVMARFFNNKRHVEFEGLINNSFITKSKEQTDEIYKIKNLAISSKPIFINGETGTGKRVVSHLIKDICQASPFIEINCSQYSENLLASELFGHKRGSFTGANSEKKGLLEIADGGIVFLDEIHALSLNSQKTLLKALEEKEFYPVGSNRPVKSNFRIITATCEDIQEMINKGEFREDLFGRISTFQINLLPLRERKEDILLLLEYFISKHLVQILLTSEAKKILKEYSWPRNTREIQDLVENWIVEGHRLITPEVIPSHIKNNTSLKNKMNLDAYLDMVEAHGLSDVLVHLKKELVLGMIKRNKTMKKAAEIMDVSYPSLSKFLKNNRGQRISNKGQGL